MENFLLTRKEAAELLLTIQGKLDNTPLAILQKAWLRTHSQDLAQALSHSAIHKTRIPPIFEKLMKKKMHGFSLAEVVMLGNQIEYTNYSINSVQNWVKRDFKNFLGSPREGKKYSIEQVAMLLMIEDLRTNLDFESIRKLFQIIFREPIDDSDDLITPTDLFFAYSSLFEELDQNNDQLLDVSGHDQSLRNQDALMEQLIRIRAESFASKLNGLSTEQREAVRNMLVIALISVQTSYFNSLARRYLHATLFLNNLY